MYLEKIQYLFMIKTLQKLGIAENYLNLIKSILKTNFICQPDWVRECSDIW